MMLFSQFSLKIAAIADLCDDVAVSIRCKDLVALQNIGVIEFFEDIYFWKEKLLKLLRF